MFKISLNCKDKKFRSNRLEFQPSFIVKLLFITVLQSRGACFREKSKFFKSVNVFVIYLDELWIYKWSELWNINGRFPESRGLRTSVSSSPLPLPLLFFCSRSNFRAITGLETLATQARKNQYNSINGKSVSSISTDWSMQKISIKSDLPIFIDLSIDYSGRMWARAFWKWCCKSTWAFPFQWRK